MSENKFKQGTAPLAALYAIVNIDEQPEPYIFVENLLSAGVSLVQLRNKTLSQTQVSKIITKILTLRQRYKNTKILINDSVDLAKACGADGVHLGQTDECPKVARAALGPAAIIGLSNHSLEQISQAPFEQLNYLAMGPVFHSITKSGHAAEVGLEKLAEAVRISKLPIVAIGGINKQNIAEVFKTGIASAAVISDLRNVENLPEYNSLFTSLRQSTRK